MDRLESMRVLVAVVDAGSFSAAARHLRMPLPTVSRRIAELERRVSARLLQRTTRTLALTDAGQSYVAACRRILEEVAEAERSASGEYSSPRGELVVTAPVVFGRLHVVPIVAEFLHAFEEIDIRLVLTDHALDLINDRIDVALRVGSLPDSRLIAVRVGQVRSVVCASPAYLKAHGRPKTPDDLAAHECVTFATLFVPETWVFRAGRRDNVAHVRSRLVVNTAEAAIDAAVAGIGLTRVLSYQVAAMVKARKLVVALRDFEPEPLPVNLLYAGEPPLPRKLRAFLDFAAPRLKARLAEGRGA